MLRNTDRLLELPSQTQDFVTKSQRNSLVTQLAVFSFVAGLSALMVFSQQQFFERRFQEQYTAVLVGGETIPNTPSILSRAIAIAGRQVNEGDIEAAIESYKEILIAANRFFGVIERDETLFLEEDIGKVRGITQVAEEKIAAIVSEHYILQLTEDLTVPLFGELKINSPVTDGEERYTEGALRATYKILMDRPGIDSDMNDDGYLSATEALFLPCVTLKQIEKLWREATAGKCGFHENGDFFIDEDCNQLSNYTLTERIFPRPFTSFEERAKLCGILEAENANK